MTPKFVTGHPSAECTSDPADALGLQHDVEATPKGDVIFNTEVPRAARGEAQLILDASDAQGRCHDQGAGGASGAPQGGLEIVDITRMSQLDNDQESTLCPANQVLPNALRCAVEIALTSHIGEAHTVNVDPRRPHIAYAVTSDAIGVTRSGGTASNKYRRGNESFGADQNDLDGFEVVDLSSCLNFPADATVATKRLLCKPVVYRYRFPTATAALGHTVDNAIYGCHELEIYPNDRLTCGSGGALLVFDMAGAFDKNGTPRDFTDDKPRGTPLPCNVRPSTSTVTPTGAKVTDCVVGANGQDLQRPGLARAGCAVTRRRQVPGQRLPPGPRGPFNSDEDIDFDHEAELSASGKFLLATDERGGGVVPPGATCAPGANDNRRSTSATAASMPTASRYQQGRPTTPAAAWEAYART